MIAAQPGGLQADANLRFATFRAAEPQKRWATGSTLDFFRPHPEVVAAIPVRRPRHINDSHQAQDLHQSR